MTKFSPESWSRAGQVFSESSGAMRGVALTSGASGGGPAAVDEACAQIVAQFADQWQSAVDGLGGGMAADASVMMETASTYEAAEANATATGSKAGF